MGVRGEQLPADSEARPASQEPIQLLRLLPWPLRGASSRLLSSRVPRSPLWALGPAGEVGRWGACGHG